MLASSRTSPFVRALGGSRSRFGHTHCARPANEPILDYSAAHSESKHRRELVACLEELEGADQPQDVPIIIDGKEYRTEQVRYQVMPFAHAKRLARFYHATPQLIRHAASVASSRRREWDLVPLEERARVFERAASLVSGPYRARLNAATMLGQAKTIKQAELDAAAELADFFRFNAHYARLLAGEPSHALADLQPHQGPPGAREHNSLELRGLEGFVAAISPFNFTAIAGNLINAPALMGNCVVWKPSDTAVWSNYLLVRLLQEAGLPGGVVNFVPAAGLDFGRVIGADARLAGINFTGSAQTFRWLWIETGLNVARYAAYPRLVGECGGKNFHLVHASAHLDSAVAQTIRSAFEYSGQKCSACSRLYVAASVWPRVRDQLVGTMRAKVRLGSPCDLDTSYTSAVIDAAAFARISHYLEYAKRRAQPAGTSGGGGCKILSGGKADDSLGYYVEPTLVEVSDPRDRLMREEIFGPLLSVFVYEDAELEETLELIDESEFALTGALFARDEQFIGRARKRLRMSAGNLYINDKSTGAVVGQQPFGGARLSGTNDKAGGPFHLLRWANQLTVKRTSRPLTEI